MISYFYDIVNGTALPPHQVGAWIPKAKKMGPEADNFRPLGMPNTLDPCYAPNRAHNAPVAGCDVMLQRAPESCVLHSTDS